MKKNFRKTQDTQQEMSERLGVATNTVSAWVKDGLYLREQEKEKVRTIFLCCPSTDEQENGLIAFVKALGIRITPITPQ